LPYIRFAQVVRQFIPAPDAHDALDGLRSRSNGRLIVGSAKVETEGIWVGRVSAVQASLCDKEAAMAVGFGL
jgi:hypothetical protein